MEKIKKMVSLFKSEKCWDHKIKIKDDYIKTEYYIYNIPKEDKREDSTFIYYFDEPKIKYYCWREDHHNGSHWDGIDKTIRLGPEEKEQVDKKIFKLLKSSIKNKIESKVIDIMCNMYIDKKIEEMDETNLKDEIL